MINVTAGGDLLMNRKIMIVFLSVIMGLSGCSASSQNSSGTGSAADPVKLNGGNSSAEDETVQNEARPMLLSAEINQRSTIVPDLPDYTVASDFSNTINQSLVAYMSDEMREQLLQNYFLVTDGYSYEFHEVYEENKYDYVPSFITSDSLLHAFHLYYAHIQKDMEQTVLKDALADMSMALYEESEKQLSSLKGSEWESAAQRNLDYSAVAASLLDCDVNLSERAQAELDAIMNAQGISVSGLFSTEDRAYQQDYSQFRPRGYYTESEALEQYFRAMMWYGQMNFAQNEEDLNRSALLMNLAIRNSAETEWNKVYTTTAFFAGESDDSGYCEYLPVIEAAYGKGVTENDLPGKKEAFEKYRKLTEQMPAPQINSVAVFERETDRDQITRGYRVLGQRFTIDGYIMQRLVYRDVDEAEGKRRSLPDALDVPAALGSDEALRILKETTDIGIWPGYTENMQELKDQISEGGDDLWPTSISASWLGSLTPLTEIHGQGWPKFMQNAAWQDKDLNTFLGSYTELKHDTVLYAKQVMAEMGAAGWETVPPDDRGYVEPQVNIYMRLSASAKQVKEGLKKFGLLSDENAELTDHIIMIADRLTEISEKELKGELPSDDDFDFIRSYGGQLEHLWMKTVDDGTKEYYRTMDHPSSLVTDIATDPDGGRCLEIGTGLPDRIYVLVQFDGEIRICQGAVYSFYQFTKPLSERMTDDEWNELTRFNKDLLPDRPLWVSSFYRRYESAQHVGSDRLGYIGMAYILVDDLNSRSEPSLNGEKLEPVENYTAYQVYEIKENDGYTWYRIGDNRWIADQNGKWVSYQSVD